MVVIFLELRQVHIQFAGGFVQSGAQVGVFRHLLGGTRIDDHASLLDKRHEHKQRVENGVAIAVSLGDKLGCRKNCLDEGIQFINTHTEVPQLPVEPFFNGGSTKCPDTLYDTIFESAFERGERIGWTDPKETTFIGGYGITTGFTQWNGSRVVGNAEQ